MLMAQLSDVGFAEIMLCRLCGRYLKEILGSSSVILKRWLLCSFQEKRLIVSIMCNKLPHFLQMIRNEREASIHNLYPSGS